MNKKTHLYFFFFLSFSLIAQENFYTQTLKELIAIRTLLAENRISDFSEFTEKYKYVNTNNLEDGRSLFIKPSYLVGKSEDYNKDNLTVGFFVGGDERFIAFLTKTNDDGTYLGEISKLQRHNILVRLFESMQVGMPYNMFKLMKDGFLNNPDFINKKMDFENISRYKFRVGSKDRLSDWKTYTASNFTTFLSDETKHVFTFFGPGKIDDISIIVPKHNDADWNDKVSPLFLIEVQKISDSYADKEPFNIPFFMSLKNFNDRIWLDN